MHDLKSDLAYYERMFKLQLELTKTVIDEFIEMADEYGEEIPNTVISLYDLYSREPWLTWLNKGKDNEISKAESTGSSGSQDQETQMGN